ncbi:PREDICTED: uncharacterized protein LOC108355622 [Rhagoletis zephyria]|uniref:uncharacterized protein LOC108355622 n=1 Tax=Rhagoletis zephyria TaxID=28612 RepID=UPI0008116A38|nr:PREDICTED: uncharacterized protein LOC108355622 [Rhagoletis zephyria]
MEAEGIDVDKYDFQGKLDDAFAKDEQKDEAACSSKDVQQTSGKVEEQQKSLSSSTAMDMNTLLAAMSQMSSEISSQLQVQGTRISSQLDEKITQLQENLFKNNSELRERQIKSRNDKIKSKRLLRKNRTKPKLRWMSLKIVSGVCC